VLFATISPPLDKSSKGIWPESTGSTIAYFSHTGEILQQTWQPIDAMGYLVLALPHPPSLNQCSVMVQPQTIAL